MLKVALNEVLQIMNSPFVSTWIWLKPRGLDAMFGRLMPKNIKQYVEFVNERVNERLEQEESAESKGTESGRKDMLHYLFRAVDPETGRRGYSRLDLIAEADMLAVGAADTTAATIAATFFYLARNPLAYRKLSEEIRTTFQLADDIKMGPQLNSCKYLRAAINETLRMNPPGANEFPREVLAGGIKIGDHYLPAGVNVGCGFYALFHDENIYKDPFVFRPERWIVGDDVSEEDVAIAERAFAPFSLGVRGCPGKGLALMELSILLARTSHGYEFRLERGDKTGEGYPGMGWGRNNRGQYQTRDAFGPLRDGPYIRFTRRA
jgi:cytochrome P450